MAAVGRGVVGGCWRGGAAGCAFAAGLALAGAWAVGSVRAGGGWRWCAGLSARCGLLGHAAWGVRCRESLAAGRWGPSGGASRVGRCRGGSLAWWGAVRRAGWRPRARRWRRESLARRAGARAGSLGVGVRCAGARGARRGRELLVAGGRSLAASAGAVGARVHSMYFIGSLSEW